MGETSTALLLVGVVVLILVAVAIFVGILVYMQRGQSKKQAQEEASRPQPRLPEKPAADPLAQAEPQVAVPPIEAPRLSRRGHARGPRRANGPSAGGGRRPAIHAHPRDQGCAGGQAGAVGHRRPGALYRRHGDQPPGGTQRRSGAKRSNKPRERIARPRGPGEPDAARATCPIRSAGDTTGYASGTDSRGQPVERAEGPDVLPPAGATPAYVCRFHRHVPCRAPASSVLEFFRRGFQPPAATGPGSASRLVYRRDRGGSTILAWCSLPYDVHVKTGPQGKLQIEVGPNVYGSPSSIPDPEVQELIETAVAEWERR